MLKKVDRFMFINKKAYGDEPFDEKTGKVLDLALSFIKEDVAEELRGVVSKILDTPFDYGLDDYFMQELMFEWFSIYEVLDWCNFYTILIAIKKGIADVFFKALSRNDIKIVDQEEVEVEQ